MNNTIYKYYFFKKYFTKDITKRLYRYSYARRENKFKIIFLICKEAREKMGKSIVLTYRTHDI